MQVNPLIVDGQVHGGVVQGLAQALFEEAVYDEDGNLQDVLRWPTTWCRPPATSRRSRSATRSPRRPTNPLGVKGIGEAGTIGAAPAVINAIVDALVRSRCRATSPMPASPQNVWAAIQSANGADQ